jgi:hypothetical protein
VAGGCGDDDLVRRAMEAAIDETDVPARHFADEVASGTRAASVSKAGGSAVAVAGDVIKVSDGCVTEGIPTGLVAEPDELGEPAVEVPAGGILTHNRAGSGWDWAKRTDSAACSAAVTARSFSNRAIRSTRAASLAGALSAAAVARSSKTSSRRTTRGSPDDGSASRSWSAAMPETLRKPTDKIEREFDHWSRVRKWSGKLRTPCSSGLTTKRVEED